MASRVHDEQERFFPGPTGWNLRTCPHNISRRVRCSAPRLPEQPVSPPIRLRQSWHNNPSRDRPPFRRRGRRIHSLQETWNPEVTGTPCPNVRENRLLRRKKIQADNRLLDSTFCRKFSAISTTLS